MTDLRPAVYARQPYATDGAGPIARAYARAKYARTGRT